MKKTIFYILLQFSLVLAFAQDGLMIQKGDRGLYLNHTVAAKESFFSLGRSFGLAPKELADYNQLDMSKGLNIGQVIQIPLTSGNFIQTAEGKTPVYYLVQTSEGLYRVSVKNNNVLMADLRKWNHLTNDQINAGQKLVVGYLKTDGVATTTQPAPSTPPASKPVAAAPKDPDPIKPEQPAPVKRNQPEPVSRPATTATSTGGGFFHPHYDLQQKKGGMKKDETASAGIFKTESGWTDQKFYVLMNKVEPGTIVKITNPSNQRVIYAKVLGEMSGIRQNMGYDVRLSSAAASSLDINDTEKFIVRVNY